MTKSLSYVNLSLEWLLDTSGTFSLHSFLFHLFVNWTISGFVLSRLTQNLLIPFREGNVFFEVIPGVLGRLVNFNIKISIKTAWLSVSCFYKFHVLEKQKLINTKHSDRLSHMGSWGKVWWKTTTTKKRKYYNLKKVLHFKVSAVF